MRGVSLPYLWAAKGRGGKLYFYYRRAGLRIPIKSPEGYPLRPGDAGFYEAYAEIDATFAKQKREGPKIGTLAHLVQEYRQSADYLTNIGKTSRKAYEPYLTVILEKHGEGLIRTLPREAVLKMRDEHKATPGAANMLLRVWNILLNFAEERPLTFRLPLGWRNPASKIKKLKAGKGHRPWEEYEIEQFREEWEIGTLERTVFEVLLNTGQRGIDVAQMLRRHRHEGQISVRQQKTGKRVYIPESKELTAALDPWLQSHNHAEFFHTPTGKPLKPDYMRSMMRTARQRAGLPEDCALHGLRYTFATRAVELGLDIRDTESIIGHEATEMMWKYIRQRRRAQLTIYAMDRGLENRRLHVYKDDDEMGPPG